MRVPQVMVGGAGGDHCAPNDAAFLEFARSLPTPELADAIEVATPLSPLVGFKSTANVRRFYDKAWPPFQLPVPHCFLRNFCGDVCRVLERFHSSMDDDCTVLCQRTQAACL
jgi:hypothetical protein